MTTCLTIHACPHHQTNLLQTCSYMEMTHNINVQGSVLLSNLRAPCHAVMGNCMKYLKYRRLFRLSKNELQRTTRLQMGCSPISLELVTDLHMGFRYQNKPKKKKKMNILLGVCLQHEQLGSLIQHCCISFLTNDRKMNSLSSIAIQDTDFVLVLLLEHKT